MSTSQESRKALATLGEDSFKLRTSRTLNLLFLSLLAFMRTQFQSIIFRVSTLSESESHCWSPWMVRRSPQDFPEARGTGPENESHDEIREKNIQTSNMGYFRVLSLSICTLNTSGIVFCLNLGKWLFGVGQSLCAPVGHQHLLLLQEQLKMGQS